MAKEKPQRLSRFSSSIHESDPSQQLISKVQATYRLYMAAGSALMGALGLGMVLGYTSPAIPKMKRPENRFPVDDDVVSWFESLMALGGLVGGLLAGAGTERIGPRSMLFFCAPLFVSGWLSIAYATNTIFLYVGRVLTGVCCGVISGTTPMYVIEISTPNIRGFLGSFYQLALACGVLLATVIGTLVPWTWLAVISSLPAIVMMVGMTLAPETPQWLLSKGRHNEAVASAASLYGSGISMSCQMITIVESVHCNDKLTLHDFRQRSIYMPTLFSMVLLFVQQFCGINPISFNTVEIFLSSGSTLMSPNTANMVVNASQVFANFLSTILMDKLGRRILLITSGGGMGLSLLSFGFYYYFLDSPDIVDVDFKANYGWIPLASLIVFVVSFATGFGPVSWLMMSEMVPHKARGRVTGIGSAFNWTCGFAVTKLYNCMIHTLKPAGTYWSYCIVSILGALFGWFCIPETKGKTFSEIERYFRKDTFKKSIDKAAIIDDVVIHR